MEGSGVSENVIDIAGLIQALKDKSLIAEASPRVLEEMKIVEEEKEREKEVVVVEKVVKVSDGEAAKKRSALRMGSEGVEVRALQVCSRNLKSN